MELINVKLLDINHPQVFIPKKIILMFNFDWYVGEVDLSFVYEFLNILPL